MHTNMYFLKPVPSLSGYWLLNTLMGHFKKAFKIQNIEPVCWVSQVSRQFVKKCLVLVFYLVCYTTSTNGEKLETE